MKKEITLPNHEDFKDQYFEVDTKNQARIIKTEDGSEFFMIDCKKFGTHVHGFLMSDIPRDYFSKNYLSDMRCCSCILKANENMKLRFVPMDFRLNKKGWLVLFNWGEVDFI